jgi:hypothetical protein
MVNLSFLENPYIFGGLALILILYGSTAGTPVPLFVKNLFQHPVFQILIFSLIVYKCSHNPQIAIIIAVAFLIIITLINDQEIHDDFRKIEAFTRISR